MEATSTPKAMSVDRSGRHDRVCAQALGPTRPAVVLEVVGPLHRQRSFRHQQPSEQKRTTNRL